MRMEINLIRNGRSNSLHTKAHKTKDKKQPMYKKSFAQNILALVG